MLIAAHESERLQNFFNAFAAEYAYDNSDRERYRMYFWAGAAYNLMYIWLREGMPISPDTLADYCNTAAAPKRYRKARLPDRTLAVRNHTSLATQNDLILRPKIIGRAKTPPVQSTGGVRYGWVFRQRCALSGWGTSGPARPRAHPSHAAA